MGSVYIATCNDEIGTYENFVKIGFSHDDNPTESMNSVAAQFTDSNNTAYDITHTCCACYTSKYYKCIEEYLHAYFEEHRSCMYILPERPHGQYLRQEYYNISTKKALIAFKKAIVKIEGYNIKCVACPFCSERRLYRITGERVNTNERTY